MSGRDLNTPLVHLKDTVLDILSLKFWIQTLLKLMRETIYDRLKTYILIRPPLFLGSEFSNNKIESRDRVMQNGVTLWITNSKVLQKFFFWVPNSTSLFNFEILTRRLNFYFSTFELLTQSWKIKISTSSY